MTIVMNESLMALDNDALRQRVAEKSLDVDKRIRGDKLRMAISIAEARMNAPASEPEAPQKVAAVEAPKPVFATAQKASTEAASLTEIARVARERRRKVPVSLQGGRTPIEQEELIEYYAQRAGNRKGRMAGGPDVKMGKAAKLGQWIPDETIGSYNDDPNGVHLWFGDRKRIRQDANRGNEPIVEQGEIVTYGDSGDILMSIDTELAKQDIARAEAVSESRNQSIDDEESVKSAKGRSLSTGTTKGRDDLMSKLQAALQGADN